jgi:gas vesicle protein
MRESSVLVWIQERLNRVVNLPLTGWVLWAAFLITGTYWEMWQVPATGYAVAVLGFAAALMSVLTLSSTARFFWILLLFAFLSLEMRAIEIDRAHSAKAFENLAQQASNNLQKILSKQTEDVTRLLHNQQGNFTTTIDRLTSSERDQTRRFGELLATEEQLFNSEQQLAEFLNGRLLPSAQPTPTNKCGTIPADDVIVLLGATAFVTHDFPHPILRVGNQSVLSLERLAPGSLVLSVEMRALDNRIIARLDRNGFITNSNYYLLRPDKSTAIIENEYGEEILNAQFLNRQAFRVSGTLQYRNRRIPLELPGFTDVCIIDSPSPDIQIN